MLPMTDIKVRYLFFYTDDIDSGGSDIWHAFWNERRKMISLTRIVNRDVNSCLGSIGLAG